FVFVVDGRVGRAPAVRGLVDLDLTLQLRVGERLLEDVLRLRLTHVVVLGDREQVLRLRLRDQKMRAVRGHRRETAAVERTDRADAIGHGRSRTNYDRAAHAVADRADLLALVDFTAR